MTGCEPANATQSSKWGKWFIAEFAPHLCADGRRRCGPLRVPKGASAGPAVSGARAGCARVCTSLEWDVGQVLGRLVVYVAIGNGVPVGVGERVGGSRRRLPGHAGPDDRPARRRRARPGPRMDLPFVLGTVVSVDRARQGAGLCHALHRRAGVRVRVLRNLRRHRSGARCSPMASSTFSSDVAYSRSPAASSASAWSVNHSIRTTLRLWTVNTGQ
jgi:hypothetical protein